LFNVFGKISVGIDMDSKEIRIVALKLKKGKISIVSCDKINISEGIIRDGIVVDPIKAGNVLYERISNTRLKRDKIILGINNTDILVRFANLPKVPEEKLKGLVKYQVQDYFPIPINNVELDYMIAGEVTNKEGTFYKVMLVAARKDMIEGFLKMMDEADIELSDIDVSMLSIIRLLPVRKYEGTSLIINMDNDITGILLVEKGLPVLARISAIGYVKMKEYLSRSEKIVAVSSTGAFIDRSGPVDSLMSEIRSSISYYNSRNDSVDVEKILLTGKIGSLDGFIKDMEDAFSIPVEIVNPFEEISGFTGNLEYDAAGISSYSVAASLALRGLEEYK